MAGATSPTPPPPQPPWTRRFYFVYTFFRSIHNRYFPDARPIDRSQMNVWEFRVLSALTQKLIGGSASILYLYKINTFSSIAFYFKNVEGK